MKTIRLSVLSFAPDRSSFKQYSPHFTPVNNLVVEIPLEDELVTVEDNGETEVMSMRGFAVLLDIVASEMDRMHQDYLERE